MTELVTKNIVDRTFAANARDVPWTVHAEWVVGGRLEGRRLVEAAGATMAEHPMLSARQGVEDFWILPDEPASPPVGYWTVADDGAVRAVRNRVVSRRFDLYDEPPVRFEVIRGPETDRVVVVADHALVDGLGVGRTVVSLMSAYVLGDRGRVDSSWREARTLAAAVPSREQIEKTVHELREKGATAAVRLAPEPIEEGHGYGVTYHQLSDQAVRGLASVSHGPLTANDILVGAFCDAGMEWNSSRRRPVLPFAVGVPLNLRPARTWFDGVCNATLPWPVYVDDTAPDEMLRQVSGQLRQVRSGLYSPAVRAVLGHLARRTQLSLRDRLALATTTVVSIVPGADVARAHLPPHVGSADLYGGAPAPPAMGITFGVVLDKGVIRLSARYLRSRHTSAGVTRFLSSVDAAVVHFCDLLITRPRAEAAL